MKFSSRLLIPSQPNALFARKLELESEGREIIDLTILNPTLVGIDYPQAEIRNLLSATDVTYDPKPLGPMTARVAVCRYLAGRGIAMEPEHVCLTASTSESFSLIFKLLADPGESVLAPQPGYPLLDHLAPLDGLNVVGYRVTKGGELHVDETPPEARAIMIVAPHMPYGTLPDAGSWQRVADLCHEGNRVIILDEVFADYAPQGVPSRPAGDVTIFRLGGLSKTAGLPGFKIGWMAVENANAELMRRLETFADAYLSANQIAAGALPGLITLAPVIREKITDRVTTNLVLLRKMRLASTGASWTAVIEIEDDEETRALELLEKGYWTQPGYLYDLPDNHLVLSLLSPPDQFAKGLREIGC